MRDKIAQKKYITERVKGKSYRKAAKAAGISKATAFRAERDPEIKSAMARALERVGCTEDKIAQTVLEALDATKVISANVVAPNGEGMKDAHSMTKDFIDVPDYAVRCKAAELAGKFRGDFASDREDTEIHFKFSFGD
jgi:hypothetical protein